jgi:hypothetical protein
MGIIICKCEKEFFVGVPDAEFSAINSGLLDKSRGPGGKATIDP